jgi:hypothetical protein
LPERSLQSRRSTSGSPSTTQTAWRDTGSSREGVRAQLERLAALPLAGRREVPALDPDRAPVIVAGTVILGEVLDHFGLDSLEASEHDILDGAALEAAELPEPKKARRRPALTPAASKPSRGPRLEAAARPRPGGAGRELRERTPTSRPPSVTGTRSRSSSSRKAKGFVERQVGVERVSGRLGDLAHGRLRRVPARCDDVAHERPARDDTDESLVLGDEDGPDLRPRQKLAGLLRGRVAAERARLRQHRIADAVGHG